MTVFTPNQIGVLAYGANWGPGTPGAGDKNTIDFLEKLVATCHGESGWDSNAVNGQAVGLFQIMTELHKDLIGGRDMLKPHYNVQVAKQLSDGDKRKGLDPFHPWDAYNRKTPAYKSGLGHGKSVYEYLKSKGHAAILQEYLDISEVDTGQAIDVDQQVGDAIDSGLNSIIPDPVGKVLSFVRDAGVAVGVFAMGGLLLILGLWFLIAHSKAGKTVTSIAANANPVTAAVKGLK